MRTAPRIAQTEAVEWLVLRPGVYCRRYEPWDVTVGAIVGAHGVLLIDTRANVEEGAELREHLKALDLRPPGWVVNTHAHFDHVGGNACFPEAEIIVAGQSVDLGDRTVQVRHPGRGHTGADLIVLTEGVVFAGDLVEESGPLQYDELSKPAEWPATNQRLLELVEETDLVVPGHGAVVDRAFVAAQQAFIEAVARRDTGG